MRESFTEVREKLSSFVETGEDSYFSSAINSLYYNLTNSHPAIPDVVYPLEELQSYSNKLQVASSEEEKQKYYQLTIHR